MRERELVGFVILGTDADADADKTFPMRISKLMYPYCFFSFVIFFFFLVLLLLLMERYTVP